MKKASYSDRGCLAVQYGGMASGSVGPIPLAASPVFRVEARPTAEERPKASRSGFAKGFTALEFAMVASVFFLLVFGVMDYGWMFFAQMNVQQAVDDGGRFASTGNHTTVVSNGTPTTLSRLQSIITFIQNQISVPGVNVQQNLVVCSTNGGCSNAGGSAPAGGPGDTVTLTLTTSLPLFTPALSALFTGGAFTFTSSTTFKNEPFNPSQTN
jgi:Flp pilus assembly protein TadG